MGTAVKRTISLPSTLSRELEEIAREEGKTISAIIQDALRLAKHERVKKDVRAMQDYWSRKAKERGILTERDLRRYLATEESVSAGIIVRHQRPAPFPCGFA